MRWLKILALSASLLLPSIVFAKTFSGTISTGEKVVIVSGGDQLSSGDKIQLAATQDKNNNAKAETVSAAKKLKFVQDTKFADLFTRIYAYNKGAAPVDLLTPFIYAVADPRKQNFYGWAYDANNTKPTQLTFKVDGGFISTLLSANVPSYQSQLQFQDASGNYYLIAEWTRNQVDSIVLVYTPN